MEPAETIPPEPAEVESQPEPKAKPKEPATPPIQIPPIPHYKVDEPDPNAIHVLITGFGVSIAACFVLYSPR